MRLLPTAAAAWAAAFLAVRLPPSSGWLTAGIVAAVSVGFLLLTGVLARRRPAALSDRAERSSRAELSNRAALSDSPARFNPAALFRGTAVPLAAVALVCAGAAGALAERSNGPMAGVIAAERSVSGEFRAVSDARAATPDRFTGRPRYLVDAVADSATADGKRFGSAAPILVVGGDDYAGIRWGDGFSSAGALSKLPPGDRNLALLRAAAAPDIRPAGGWYGATAQLRADFVQASADRGVSVDGLLAGMVLGDRSTLDPDLGQAMKTTGLTHLTAVSGANCSYLLAFIFLTARAARVPRAAAVLLALAGLAAFVLLVRPDPSVLRAAVMGGLGTLAVLSGRGRLPVALLLLSITVLLAIDPWLCTSYAFILSVCATLGLVVLGPHLVLVLSRRLPLWFAASLAVPIAAQLFCAPVLVLLQPQLPVYSVPANLVAAPVVPVVTIVGMLAVAVVGLAPPLAAAPLVASAAGAWWVAGTARTFESAPGALQPWPAGGPGFVLMAAAAAGGTALVLYLSRGRSRHRDRPPRRRGHGWKAGRWSVVPWQARPGKVGRWTVAGAVVVLILPAGTVLALRSVGEGLPGQADEWVLAACDVGQGDGLAVRTGPGSAVVVDTGGEPAAMETCLDRLGVQNVDLLVLTHAHLDHYGGAAGVISGRTVREVGYSTAGAGLPRDLEDALAGSTAPRTQLTAGMTGSAGDVSWEVLWPPETAGSTSGSAAGEDDENNASAVLLLSVGTADRTPLTILLTGDAETDAATAVLASHPGLRSGVDVLKVPHHGARNGGDAWLRATRPSLAVISVGADNDYGHPAPQIIEGLERSGTAVARTDVLGTIVVAREEDALRISGLR
ncbi:ComEC/Rec2 family competence protein [Arthrobacter zhangbolii]|uniref:ComEC/Rec2 family competence protein n=1 Tax=Arthrobacter zhangbolii TaxID=2886936 RepID=A0ABY4DFF8_9MICC|nr:ComEC/Rec2 family competence protein [Arthrobacter zhangbolii]UON90816.1 ComEC/Rec2 family competence protein [Arthrobacter zhangbolii]